MKSLMRILMNNALLVIVAGTFLAVSVVIGNLSIAQSQEGGAVSAKINAPPNEEDIEAGKSVYFIKCVWCHGEAGAGDGPGADRLWPRPRSFVEGTFKIRHTGSGELPTDDDLFQTVTHGLPGSAMPSWEGILSDQERRQVIQFVKYRLVEDVDYTDPDEEFNLIDFGTQIPSSEESIARGKVVFDTKGKCLECHGPEGRGDGNATQKDEWGFPIFPAQLTKCWNFRGSRGDPYNPKNIFREVTTGLNGTPMPSFIDVLSEEQRWDVANFVMSLCERRKDGEPYPIDPLTDKPVLKFVVVSSFMEGEIPTDPDDPMWQDIDRRMIGLAGQITHKPRNFVRLVDDVWVRSMYNGNEIAYLLEWDDRNKSIATPEIMEQVGQISETPPAGDPIAYKYNSFVTNDAFAIQFSANWDSLTPPTKPRFIFGDSKNAVDIWKWDADGTVGEYTGSGWDQELKRRDSSKNLKTSHVTFKDGRWRVIMVRSMETEDKENDVQFIEGNYIPTAFFAWDGHNGDYGLKVSISTWYYTFLKPPNPTSVYVIPFIAAIIVIGAERWVLGKVKETKSKNNS
jgi:mono/diheme cytochrome c family protein